MLVDLLLTLLVRQRCLASDKKVTQGFAKAAFHLLLAERLLTDEVYLTQLFLQWRHLDQNNICQDVHHLSTKTGKAAEQSRPALQIAGIRRLLKIADLQQSAALETGSPEIHLAAATD